MSVSKKLGFTLIELLVCLVICFGFVVIGAKVARGVINSKGYAVSVADLERDEIIKIVGANEIEGVNYLFIQKLKAGQLTTMPQIYSGPTNELTFNKEDIGKLLKVKIEYICSPEKGVMGTRTITVPLS